MTLDINQVTDSAQQWLQLFPALILNASQVVDNSGKPVWYFDWVEQDPDPVTGKYRDSQCTARRGDTVTGPFLVSANNQYVAPGTLVWCRFKASINGVLTYEFETEAPIAYVSVASTGPTYIQLGTVISANLSGNTLTTYYPIFDTTMVGAGLSDTNGYIPANTIISTVASPTQITTSNSMSNGQAIAVTLTTSVSFQAWKSYLTWWDAYTGKWVQGITPVWYFEANGAAPVAGHRYQCRLVGQDVKGVQIWCYAEDPTAWIIPTSTQPVTILLGLQFTATATAGSNVLVSNDAGFNGSFIGLTIQGLGIPGRTITDGAVTKDSAVLTSSQANFQSSDLGSFVSGNGIPLNTTINAVNSPSSITMSANATATLSNQLVQIGTPTTITSWPGGNTVLMSQAATLTNTNVVVTCVTGLGKAYPARSGQWSYDDQNLNSYYGTSYPQWFIPADNQGIRANWAYQGRKVGVDAYGTLIWVAATERLFREAAMISWQAQTIPTPVISHSVFPISEYPKAYPATITPDNYTTGYVQDAWIIELPGQIFNPNASVTWPNLGVYHVCEQLGTDANGWPILFYPDDPDAFPWTTRGLLTNQVQGIGGTKIFSNNPPAVGYPTDSRTPAKKIQDMFTLMEGYIHFDPVNNFPDIIVPDGIALSTNYTGSAIVDLTQQDQPAQLLITAVGSGGGQRDGLIVTDTGIVFGITPDVTLPTLLQGTLNTTTGLWINCQGLYAGANGTDANGNIFLSGLCVNVGNGPAGGGAGGNQGSFW